MHVSFHLADSISVYHVVFICFQLLNFDINFYISMSFSSTSTGRNAGCAGESLHYPCKGFWEGLQESHQKGWPRTWLLQVVNQLFMPSPYLLLLHYLTIIMVILRLRHLIALIEAAMLTKTNYTAVLWTHVLSYSVGVVKDFPGYEHIVPCNY